jgi:UDP-D-galactose:(glucosyl)LPS alpha-1,6-D-galactosyltransferase
MDAIVLTSKYEGLPMVLNEAISMGIPVVSSNCETGPDDIINRNNGLIYNLESTADLVRCLNLMALKKNNFKNIMQIKESINKFYSDVFFNNFLRSIR